MGLDLSLKPWGEEMIELGETISRAIISRQPLVINYSGEERTIEPYTMGISRAGNPVLRAYQTDGGSVSAETEGWKLFDLSKMDTFVFPDKKITKFAIRPEYKNGDRAFFHIFKEV